jgi:DNA modification methylase
LKEKGEGLMSDFKLFGEDVFGNKRIQAGGIMKQRYLFPPFSVLDGRLGPWLTRKRAWLKLGIKSELGRGQDDKISKIKRTRHCAIKLETSEKTSPFIKKAFESAGLGTSVFDPVLCELMYTWFCPDGGQVIDPFAGGSVRGIVASLMGFSYWGCDLNSAQIEANRVQAEDICPDGYPEWVCGDSLETLKKAPKADFIMTCPPYADLEIYSDDPRDLSTMEYPQFLEAYKKIIMLCYERLEMNRLACFVVSDIRDKKGYYRGFVADTINIFHECGFNLYNDIVLINPAGSLFVRAGKSFDATRKLGKMHQNVLVFIKGEPKKMAKIIKNNKKESGIDEN